MGDVQEYSQRDHRIRAELDSLERGGHLGSATICVSSGLRGWTVVESPRTSHVRVPQRCRPFSRTSCCWPRLPMAERSHLPRCNRRHARVPHRDRRWSGRRTRPQRPTSVRTRPRAQAQDVPGAKIAKFAVGKRW